MNLNFKKANKHLFLLVRKKNKKFKDLIYNKKLLRPVCVLKRIINFI